jgi:hypothetical protein
MINFTECLQKMESIRHKICFLEDLQTKYETEVTNMVNNYNKQKDNLLKQYLKIHNLCNTEYKKQVSIYQSTCNNLTTIHNKKIQHKYNRLKADLIQRISDLYEDTDGNVYCGDVKVTQKSLKELMWVLILLYESNESKKPLTLNSCVYR